ncbi:TRAP transporter large permease [Oceanibaculum indicum]|uniref:TRAP transporter large permease protein n=2 Tax=Oceanibaculum indicum TaxID=526216 RepID=K2JW13_9PROT|nr:TRAP transporter large permease subunit [Oceanibaculum indicum]EKE69420.1 TRAP dicarboxylate transporter subunit DctM [Oceanibaculum indicum P24]RKQ69912.1 tripartite ATP-independent transporter DctM subunit [Oceanibaculum indicum]
MSPNEILAILTVVSFFTMLMVGVPVAVGLAVSGFVFGYIGFGPLLFNLLPARIFGVVSNYTLLAIPLFVFMGVMLEKSKLAEELLDVVGHLSGSMRGGMGIAIVLVGVLMGASTGIVGATIVTLGLLTLPALLRRGYDKGLACGTICASGTLGQIIPPSLILLLLADILGESVGTMFAAAVFPGLILAGLYVLYILATAYFRPSHAPAISAEERAALPRRQLYAKLFKVVLPPLLLVVAVLGAIIGGVAAPTEAASMGALGAILVCAVSGKLSYALLRDAARASLSISGMVFLILILSQVFGLAFRGLGGEKLVEHMFEWAPGGVTGSLIFLMLLLFVLGCFLEWIEISYIAVPLFLPYFIAQDVNLVWLGTLICVNLQTSFLTPPFGWALFFLKGVAPPGVTTGDIYRGVVPFVLLQMIGIAIVFLVPGTATWLPAAIGW